MLKFLKKQQVCPIGVDVTDDKVKVAQLAANGGEITLVAGGCERRPDFIKAGSIEWQRWAIDALKRLVEEGDFKGRNVVATIPASEVFIDHVKVSKAKTNDDGKTEQAILAKVKQKIPFELSDAMIKHICGEDDNYVVVAAQRCKIDRHLAIYEAAQLLIGSIAIWPTALTNAYVKFFGRRKSDLESAVMLVDIGGKGTNVVICRHKKLLFARNISIGTKQLADEQVISRLGLELSSCKRQFSTMQRKSKVIERLIFLTGEAVDKNVYTTIAKQLEMPTQMGDCLAAVRIVDPGGCGIERRGSQDSWATAFGLSLS